jgi:hypothetical protein
MLLAWLHSVNHIRVVRDQTSTPHHQLDSGTTVTSSRHGQPEDSASPMLPWLLTLLLLAGEKA